MDKKVTGDRLKVLERLRLVLGAQNYLAEDKIKDIFKNQKTRMGNIIDELDKQMKDHRREVVDAKGTKKTYNAWTEQGLKDKWDKYMDSKWTTATTKQKKFMDKYIDALDDKQCVNPAKKDSNQRDFCDKLGKLKTAYGKVKAFSKPW